MLRDETNFFLMEPQKKLGSLRRNVISSSSVRCTSGVSAPTMFLWSRPQHREQQGRSYKKITACDALDKWKAASPLTAGENRAIYLGLGMVGCSIVIAFLLGTKLVQSHNESVWTAESKCTILEARVTNCKNCVHSCLSDCQKPSLYPCVQIYVNLSSSGLRVLLHHSEESVRINPECFCAAKCNKNHSETEMLIASLTENSTQYQSISFPCYYDPEGRQKNVLLTRFDLSKALLHSFLWPICTFVGGIVIVIMVKLTQSLSLLKERLRVKK
ncbi:calcium-activated potassium channel subunit beta-2 [Carcharodon carcharias]|uniref:calcium-activated potassium channel subunit beta-2 n=1 Tax=Carcharodon carcharias TaxID=13397 RepID=UPI001B7F4160|nr:calcium-activated potassium channel subunit beta-2 [Carcharodon carcharias]